jgi:hypothetical protein
MRLNHSFGPGETLFDPETTCLADEPVPDLAIKRVLLG